MKKRNVLLIFLFTLLFVSCGEKVKRQETYGIVPKPITVDISRGAFEITAKTKIYLLGEDSMLTFSVAPFNQAIEEFLGKGLTVKTSASLKNGAINVLLNSSMEEEEYGIEVSNKKIEISGGSPKGVFYAFQTLRQLLPPGNSDRMQIASVELPEIKIKDKPFFRYRGAMLDVGRYFFDVDTVKEFIDVLAMHKLNTFHWHLTEDYGWRIEIKRFPNLTTIGSVREKSPFNMERGKPVVFDDTPHGGFYTQEDIKEIVNYAAERFITVIPEIELPGHATAALASYPYLGCLGKDYKVETMWRVTDEAFCAGRESTFEFLDGVFSEVVDLFPSEYIHIGGDECRKVRWKNCPDCRQRIRDESLNDEAELQSYFVRRVEDLLKKKGRKIIGWDEILEGGVSPTATVMSWRGTEGGIEAAKKGNRVIMSPSTYCYLDYYQTKDKVGEPLSIGGYLPIDTVYSFDPYKGLTGFEETHIMGVQANLWTAFINTTDLIYYMLLPRLAAVSEVAWSYRNSVLDYDDFKTRMSHFKYQYEQVGLPYAKYMFEDPVQAPEQ